MASSDTGFGSVVTAKIDNELFQGIKLIGKLFSEDEIARRNALLWEELMNMLENDERALFGSWNEPSYDDIEALRMSAELAIRAIERCRENVSRRDMIHQILDVIYRAFGINEINRRIEKFYELTAAYNQHLKWRE